MSEVVDRRVLAAIRLVDRATNTMINRHLNVTSTNASLIRNRSNLYVITHATGMEEYTSAFEDIPTVPAVGTVDVELLITDPQRRYLPQRINVAIPRDPDAENYEATDSLFQPVNVNMYASPNANVLNNWSTIRLSLSTEIPLQGQQPVAGALLRVIRTGSDEVLGSGISDQRGEALIIIPGVPITRFADEDDEEEDAVELTDLPVRIEVSNTGGGNWPPAPQQLESMHSANVLTTLNMSLRTGRMEQSSIEIS